MTLLGGCLDTELNDVPLSNCPENFGQTQKVVFQQVKDSAGAKNVFEPNHATTPTDPKLIADWNTLLAAADETKPVQSPFLSEPVSEAGAIRTFGGGNATINGVTLNIGREPQPFESKMLSVGQDSVRALKTFQRGAGMGKSTISVYLINEAGQIMMDSNISDVTDNTDVAYELFGFPVSALFIGDKTLGGLEAPDSNMLNFEFSPNWSDNAQIITPTDFDALEDLVNT